MEDRRKQGHKTLIDAVLWSSNTYLKTQSKRWGRLNSTLFPPSFTAGHYLSLIKQRATTMSRKQEYIAKVRYFNDLPAPSVPPKLLEYPVREEEKADSAKLITSLYTKTNVTPLINLDNDLGMSIDLMKIPGLLNLNDASLLYGFENVKLHPDDRVLLRDPRVDKLTKTDLSKVTFLRRTEYMSSTMAIGSTSSSNDQFRKRARDNRYQEGEENLSASDIVNRVENTFDSTTDDLEKLQHPVKRSVKAVKVWNLLPDTASMDQSYFTLRMIGSAILDKTERKNLSLKTAVFRPVELEEDEWISMYTTDPRDSNTLEKSLERVIDDKNIQSSKEYTEDDTNHKVFRFKRYRDYDMKQVQSRDNEDNSNNSPDKVGEMAILLNSDKNIAYYKPLRARIELRRRRVNEVLKQLVRENNIDQINISIRNPTTSESNMRDVLRMKFDPINFVPVDEDEEDEPGDKEGDASREENMEERKEDGTKDTDLNKGESNEGNVEDV